MELEAPIAADADRIWTHLLDLILDTDEGRAMLDAARRSTRR